MKAVDRTEFPDAKGNPVLVKKVLFGRILQSSFYHPPTILQSNTLKPLPPLNTTEGSLKDYRRMPNHSGFPKPI